jgi:hypothetical protein
MAKFLEVINVCPANKHLPAPLVIGEIVMEIPDEKYDGTRYVQVHHNGGKNVSSFDRSTFKKYAPKDKVELIKLIKNKGRNEAS